MFLHQVTVRGLCLPQDAPYLVHSDLHIATVLDKLQQHPGVVRQSHYLSVIG